MERPGGWMNTVLLLDSYDEEASMLHQSFRGAGFAGPVIVIEDNGFLPEDVVSVCAFFCGAYETDHPAQGKARYFNQIECPDYWEISGNSSEGKVHDLNRLRGRIYYAEPKHKRLVRAVEWLDERGIVRFCDHYNRYGTLYARTSYSKDGKRFCKTYFDAEGKEALVENFITRSMILNRNGRVYVFENKAGLVKATLEELGLTQSRLFFNSLSTPFFVSEGMPRSRKGDILFWQEGARDDIPGNMQIILSGRANRVRRICVQKRASYQKLIELGASPEILNPLGFVYSYKKENTYQNEALICTNSDRIEGCEELITALPNMRFHITAITEMSSKLMRLEQYPNVMLYPNVRMKKVDERFQLCDYYLDINYESEIV